jgi:hypothetical protein
MLICIKSVSIPDSDDICWESIAEGVAREGVFQRTKDPRSKFEYPKGKKMGVIAPGQVMRMKTPADAQLGASILDTPDNLNLKDFDPRIYMNKLRCI